MRGLPKRLRATAAWFGALLVLAMLATGCGSGSDTTSTTKAAPPGSQAEHGEASRATADERGDAAKATAQNGTRHRSRAEANGAAERSPASPAPGSSPAQEKSTVAPAAERAAVRSCLARLGRAACEEMVRQAEAPSTRIEEPGDCLKAMSRERCEELAAAQDTAEESREDSVNVEECIENPTPKCEAVLRPILEAQRGH